MKFKINNLLFMAAIYCLCWPLLASASSSDLNRLAKADKNKLAKIDAFHPPVQGDEKNYLYKEWHYFTMSSKNGDVTFSNIFVVEGDVFDVTKSYSFKIENYQTPIKNELTLDIFSIDMAKWYSNKPDFYLDKNSISYDGNVYHVYTESADGKVIFNAKWRPVIKPEKVISLPMQSSGPHDRVMNWLIAAAEMEVDGTLIVEKGTPSEKVYKFNDARGYHDHNWGYWDWADNFGWDWGQAIEKDNSTCHVKKYRWKFICKKHKRHSLALLNMTDSSDTEVHSSVLKIWEDDRKIKTFSGADVDIEHKMMSVAEIPGYYIPEINYISAVSGRDRLNVIFTTQNYYPMYLPIEQGYRIIWELKGTFEVNGVLNGKSVDFVTDGSMEYLGAPLLN